MSTREQLARRVRLDADPTLTKHGSLSTYVNWLCRCGPCREANAENGRKYRERKASR